MKKLPISNLVISIITLLVTLGCEISMPAIYFDTVNKSVNDLNVTATDSMVLSILLVILSISIGIVCFINLTISLITGHKLLNYSEYKANGILTIIGAIESSLAIVGLSLYLNSTNKMS
ncbi:hypothetical protein [Mycoplasma sp. B6400]|uniref:hypothetical protein n=1 Tax=unclassified Mycoplasma TaxID=2683645 RepID=UPI003AAB028C